MADSTTQAAVECPRCKSGREVFRYWWNLYEFDVDKARALTSDGREPVEVEEDSVRESVEECTIDPLHVGHVDPTIPGLIAHFWHQYEDGELAKGHVLIDGHHRAARCLQEQRPFQAYILTEEESRLVLVRGQEDAAAKQNDEPLPVAENLDPQGQEAYEQMFGSSQAHYQRSSQFIAGSTTHDRRNLGPFPVFVDRAEGALKWDVEGRPLIDFWMGHGALLFGHGFRPVVEAITQQAARGLLYGACHDLEVRWAELVCQLVPCAERVRFTSSGTEATQLAHRIARAFTGRSRIVKLDGNFHGWHDEAMVHFHVADQSGFSPGAAENVSVACPATLATIAALLEEGDVAAVILEPGGGSAGGLPWSRDFLQSLREATQEHNSLLIFDEVISGFRQTPGGVQQLSGVTPDLTTLAKILCGGMPGGAVAGRAEIMAVFGSGTKRGRRKARVPHTGTCNGHPVSAAAGIAMLEHVADGVAQQKAIAAAERLAHLINQMADANRVDVFAYTNDSSVFHLLLGVRAAGAVLGPSTAVNTLQVTHPERYALLRRALLLEGVDTNPVHGWVSAVHEPDLIEATAQAFDRAFQRLRIVKGFQLPS